MASDVKDIDPEMYRLYQLVCKDAKSDAERQEALSTLTDHAGQGNADAMMLRGAVGMHGVPGLPVDKGVALEYFERAAQLGNCRAPMYLSHMYADQGHTEKAFSLMRQSAEGGFSTGQYWLAEMYLDGDGCEVDILKAAMYARKAMEGGSIRGKHLYAKMMAKGQAMAANPKEACRMLEELWEEEHDPETAETLGHIYASLSAKQGPERARSREWYKKAADAGSEDARKALVQLDLDAAYAELENLNFGRGQLQFTMISGTLESVEDKTRVIGSTSTSNTSGTLYDAGAVGLANATTTTHTIVQRQDDLKLNVRDGQDRLYSVTMDTEAAYKTGASVGQEVRVLYLNVAESDLMFPIAFKSKVTGRFSLVRDGIPPEVEHLVKVSTFPIYFGAFASFVCLLLTGGLAPNLLMMLPFGGSLWYAGKVLQGIRNVMLRGELRRHYFEHIGRVLEVENKFLMNPA